MAGVELRSSVDVETLQFVEINLIGLGLIIRVLIRTTHRGAGTITGYQTLVDLSVIAPRGCRAENIEPDVVELFRRRPLQEYLAALWLRRESRNGDRGAGCGKQH